jgi:hypothetical protein
VIALWQMPHWKIQLENSFASALCCLAQSYDYGRTNVSANVSYACLRRLGTVLRKDERNELNRPLVRPFDARRPQTVCSNFLPIIPARENSCA